MSGRSRARRSGPSATAERITRALVEVEIAGEREWVTVTFDERSAMRGLSSAGHDSGPFVELALSAFEPMERRSSPEPLTGRESRPPTPEPVRGAPHEELGSALEDLVTAIARVGVLEAGRAASVLSAMDRVVSRAPVPVPIGLARLLGRLRREVARTDVLGVATVLDELSRPARAARATPPSRDDVDRLRYALGTAFGVSATALSDRVLVELSREWVTGMERGSLERRVLVDVRSGDLYSEWRTRSGTASLGPCPRTLRVGLAEVETGPAPRRLRVLQYEVSLGLAHADYEGILARAERQVGRVVERLRRSLKEYPGATEGFVVFAPSHCTWDDGFAAYDVDGGALGLAHGTRGRSSVFVERTRALTPEWIFGALRLEGGGVTLDPYGFGARPDGEVCYVRLR